MTRGCLPTPPTWDRGQCGQPAEMCGESSPLQTISSGRKCVIQQQQQDTSTIHQTNPVCAALATMANLVLQLSMAFEGRC